MPNHYTPGNYKRKITPEIQIHQARLVDSFSCHSTNIIFFNPKIKKRLAVKAKKQRRMIIRHTPLPISVSHWVSLSAHP
jgi:hypothetical protein